MANILMVPFVVGSAFIQAVKFYGLSCLDCSSDTETLRSYYRDRIINQIPWRAMRFQSKLAKLLTCTVNVPETRAFHRNMINESPMHRFAQANGLDILYAWWSRNARVIARLNDPVRALTLIESDNIATLARRMAFTRTLRQSPMHRFIVKNGTSIRTRIGETSPLMEWTRINADKIEKSAREIGEIIKTRKAVLSTLLLGLQDGNGRGKMLYKYRLMMFRQQNGIMNIEVDNNCNCYCTITLPKNTNTIDKFLAESNIVGFRSETIYYNKNEYQSYAYTIIPETCPDKLTDIARTYYNIAQMCGVDTEVSLSADYAKARLERCEPSEPCKPNRLIELYFMKKDMSNFKIRDYNNIKKKTSQIDANIGFIGRWLSGTVKIVITDGDPVDIIRELGKDYTFHQMIDKLCLINLRTL